MKKIIFASALFLTISACSKKEDLTLILPEKGIDMTATSLTYEEKRDNFYGTNGYQQYDMYLPNTRNTRNPIIVLLHGGAWRLGDKSTLNFLVTELKSKRVNCAIVNANYRLAVPGSGITYQQQLEDIDMLLKKVVSQSTELGISQKFFLIGMSSGGHLAIQYAQTSDLNKMVAGVGGVVPPVDLTTQTIREGIIANDLKAMIGGKSYVEAPEAYKKASPVYQYNNPTIPTIVFYGGKDAIVTPEQSEAAKKVIKSTFSNNEHYFYPDQTHDWSVWSETLDLMIKFAEKRM